MCCQWATPGNTTAYWRGYLEYHKLEPGYPGFPKNASAVEARRPPAANLLRPRHRTSRKLRHLPFGIGKSGQLEFWQKAAFQESGGAIDILSLPTERYLLPKLVWQLNEGAVRRTRQGAASVGRAFFKLPDADRLAAPCPKYRRIPEAKRLSSCHTHRAWTERHGIRC